MKAIAIILPLLISLAIAGIGCTQRTDDASMREDAPEVSTPDAHLSTAEGEILRVDSEKDRLWLKTSDGTEMQFSYTLTTDIVGAGESVEGIFDDVEELGKMSGTHVVVHYRPGLDRDILTDDEINTAVKIEVTSNSASK